MPHALSVGSFIKFGWETFKRRPWFLIGASVLFVILNLCLSFIVGIIDGVGEASGTSGATGVLSFVVNMAGGVIVAMGFIAFFLKAHDGVETAQIAEMWHPKGFWKFFALLILLYIIYIVGFILLIVPGVIAALMFMFAPYLVVDRGLGPIAALKESARITSGHKWRILALIGGIGLLSAAVCFIPVALIFAGLATGAIFLAIVAGIVLVPVILCFIPVTYIAYMHAYKNLTAAADAGVTPPALSGGEKTLAGLFLLIPIGGILAAIVLASLGVAVQKGQEAKNEADLFAVGIAIETYYDANSAMYPMSLADVTAYLPEGNTVNLADFTYTPDVAAHQTYTVCAIQPVPTGSEPCLSSAEPTATP